MSSETNYFDPRNLLGASLLADGSCRFLVWAPQAERVDLRLLGASERLVPMERKPSGYHETRVEALAPGALYRYRLNGDKERPDPASRFQPEGVHGPSQVLDSSFAWEDRAWFGLPLERYVIYELHVGAFTREGTFDAVIPHLENLKQVGVTAIELMPVAQFPGDRNWGYDGVYPFAVQNSYGGPDSLRRLVDACHRSGLAVVLDVVYNHLGPEGNYLADFAPYFTERYRTPWGRALNFDGPESDEVRRFFIQNALYWVTEFRIDALRLDAVHAILDHSPRRFVEELAGAVKRQAERLNRRVFLMPESASNDARLIQTPELGGYGLDAQWSDDFHHSLRTLLTGDRSGYYQDFGRLRQLAKAVREGFVYSGEYSSFRRRRHGTSSRAIPAARFIVFSQNHDQVGNRMRGDRLTESVSFEALKLAAGLVILSPYIPLLFMGEEYGETAPFPYFFSHSDPELIEAVRKGRRFEFQSFQWKGELPDPHDPKTFWNAKLRHELRQEASHRVLQSFYAGLLGLRRQLPPLASLDKESLEVVALEEEKALCVRRWAFEEEIFILAHLSKQTGSLLAPFPRGAWTKVLDSAEERWRGPGSRLPDVIESTGRAALAPAPESIALYRRSSES
jgi:maltooligosyltrehalose trehalohydrolase